MALGLNSQQNNSLFQQKLCDELVKLKAKLGLGGNLEVIWEPKPKPMEIRGEIKGSKIYIYEGDEDVALKTLKHEFLEFILTHEFLEPRLFEAKAHRRSDTLIDTLADLL